MATGIPEFNYVRDRKRDIFYTSRGYISGKDIEYVVITPNGEELPKRPMKEVGYGLYTVEMCFTELGYYVIVYFEDNCITGHAVYRISL